MQFYMIFVNTSILRTYVQCSLSSIWTETARKTVNGTEYILFDQYGVLEPDSNEHDV
jgi:hypothetical protein